METDLSQLEVPKAAINQYLFIKSLGDGEDGHVLLALPKIERERPALSDCVAVKILKGSNYGVMETKIKQLETAQEEVGEKFPMARIRHYDKVTKESMSWYAMDCVPGCSVAKLLEETPTFLQAGGLPPVLVFHIFTEVIKAQKSLQELGLYHGDLWAGGNVMLSPPKFGERLPVVKLIDAGGVLAWHERKATEHAKGVVVQCAIGTGNNRVPERWRRGPFSASDLGIADDFYQAMHAKGHVTLDSLSDTWSGRLERLKDSMWDEQAWKEVGARLSEAVMTEGELKKMVDKGGLTLNERQEDKWKENFSA